MTYSSLNITTEISPTDKVKKIVAEYAVRTSRQEPDVWYYLWVKLVALPYADQYASSFWNDYLSIGLDLNTKNFQTAENRVKSFQRSFTNIITKMAREGKS